MSFPKLSSPPTLTDTVAKRLLAEIQEGARAARRQAAHRNRAGRTVRRQSHRDPRSASRLRQDGIVEARQGSGVFVTGATGNRALRIDAAELRSLDAVLHIVELRRALETETRAQAAARRKKRDMAAIDAALAAISEAVAAGGDGVQEDVAFTAASRMPRAIRTSSPHPHLRQPVPGRRHPHHARQRGAPRRPDARRAAGTRRHRRGHTRPDVEGAREAARACT